MGKKRKKSTRKRLKKLHQKRKKLPGEGKNFRYQTIFINGKQKRIREPMIDGIPEDQFYQENTDITSLVQDGNYVEVMRREKDEAYFDSFGFGPDRNALVTDRYSAESEKLSLFHELFQGRPDVYARRFESATTGRAGYAPACSNEWVRGICEKPRIKCAECHHRQFLPVTEHVLRWHLTGKDDLGKPFVIGVYPMLETGRCLFLAIDFDGENWMKDLRAFRDVCLMNGLPVAIERSRSGNGGHAWFFFNKPVHSADARQLGSALLTLTMNRHPDLGFASYDRMFPNQNTMPKGGFGNLVALPLQKEARQNRNSVFLDLNFDVADDQWEFLSQIPRMTPAQVSDFVQSSTRKGASFVAPRYREKDGGEDQFSSEPWALPPSNEVPLPSLTKQESKKVEIVLADGVYLPKKQLPAEVRAHLMRLAAFQNPEFFQAQAMRLSTWDKPRVIHCADDTGEHLRLPRGCYGSILELFDQVGMIPQLTDHRHEGETIEVEFTGELRPGQMKAGSALEKHDTGVLAATTAFGKTVLAAWLIAQRGVNTLILVHRQQLMNQWVERLTQFLNIEEKQIGRLGGGRKKLRGTIDVALIQSLVRKGTVDDRIAEYGHIIVDECHHISARSFELAVSCAKARYVVGLSATVFRKDGHHPIIFMQCGPVRHRVSAQQQMHCDGAGKEPLSRTVVVRPTSVHPISVEENEEDSRVLFQRYLKRLTHNEERNQMICADVTDCVEKGSFPLVLTERTEHVDLLAELLKKKGVMPLLLTGGMHKADLRRTLQQISDSTPADKAAIVATGKFVGEGFDVSRLDRLFVTLPVSWKGTVAQYAGRLHRSHEGKSEVQIFDYADFEIPMLARMFAKRKTEYESLGYTITIPAHAIPGWPKEVPLPFDEHWKQEYAESAQSLIRDGVDIELARLFAEVTHPSPSEIDGNTTGEARARSASEAFLLRRLESLALTAGKFQLNATLPIPFGRQHEMEVDLLWRRGKLVIEIDGAQHLSNPHAYRKDRHKDLLLQEQGFFVLRFLATDLGSRYSSIMQTIQRVVGERL